MSVRLAATLAIVWVAITSTLHLVGASEHLAVIAGTLGSPVQLTLGTATVVARLFGVLVVGPCVIAAALSAVVDRLTRR